MSGRGELTHCAGPDDENQEENFSNGVSGGRRPIFLEEQLRNVLVYVKQ